MKNIIYYNGDWIEDGAIFSLDDRIVRGDGVFDTLLAIHEGGKTKLIYPDRHFDRLRHNAHVMEIAPHPGIEQLTEIAKTLCDKNKLNNGRYAINTLFTRGSGPRGVMPPPAEDTKPTITMRISPVPSNFPPINAIIARRFRRNEGSPLSQIKSTNYGDNVLALIEARHKGANEALIMNNAGKVVCASSGNIAAIIEGQIHTPPLSDGILDGITRQILMEKFDVIESSLTLSDIHNAEGIYILSSIKGCRRVDILNGKALEPPAVQIAPDFHLSEQ